MDGSANSPDSRSLGGAKTVSLPSSGNDLAGEAGGPSLVVGWLNSLERCVPEASSEIRCETSFSTMVFKASDAEDTRLSWTTGVPTVEAALGGRGGGVDFTVAGAGLEDFAAGEVKDVELTASVGA